VVAAHSMGGCLTARLALENQLGADALILYAPMFAVSDDRSPLLSSRQWFEIGKAILPDGMLVESLFPDHARIGKPRPRQVRDPFVPVRIFKYLYQEMDVLLALPPSLTLPLRLVLPGEDRVVKNAVSRAWFDSVQAPGKELLILQDAGHVLPLELDCGEEVDRICAWLQQQGIEP
jgi:alpha-beta hydrolase superfamily lysophospholipase